MAALPSMHLPEQQHVCSCPDVCSSVTADDSRVAVIVK